MGWAWRTLWACSTGWRAYPALAGARRREAARYIITVTALTTVILTLPIARELWTRMDAVVQWVQQLPTITVVEGRAGIVEDQPLRLELRDLAGVGDVAVVIDTTGATSVTDSRAAVTALITADALVLRRGAQTQRYPFAAVRRLVIDDAWLARWGRALMRWVVLLVPAALLVFSIMAMIVQAVVWGGAAWAAGRLRGLALPWSALWRLAIFAQGPPRVFAAVAEACVADRSHPLLWLVYLLVYGVLFAGAVASLRQADAPKRFDTTA